MHNALTIQIPLRRSTINSEGRLFRPWKRGRQPVMLTLNLNWRWGTPWEDTCPRMTSLLQSGAPELRGRGASLRKRPWGTCTQLGKVSHTPTKKRCGGGERQRIRAAPTLNSILENSMDWDREPNAITRKQ